MYGNILSVQTVNVPDFRISSALLKLMYRDMPNPSVVMRTAFGAFPGIFRRLYQIFIKQTGRLFRNPQRFPETVITFWSTNISIIRENIPCIMYLPIR